MGKKQHQKDKMYLTYTEWTTLYGGKKAGPEKDNFRRLPFNHCCVSLMPFKHPYCDKDGNIFELEAIIAYLNKYNHNPVTGKPLDKKSLIKLKFHKNASGEYHCPVMYKVFSNQTRIVAVATTGNVFSHEAVEQLNMKTKCWKDLLTDEPFKRDDLIVLQDTSDLAKFNLTNFHHIKNDLRVETEEEIEARTNMGRLKTVSFVTKDILDELSREYKPKVEEKAKEKVEADNINSAHFSTGAVAHGFTCTSMEPVLKHEAAIVNEDVLRYERVKKKGYVRIMTNFGPLNLQLHCDLVPKTCENFMKLCQEGYYDNTIFHRSIKHFMLQGGDPTGTGTGGESFWKAPFKDEFKPNLTHSGRGILSMANSGPDSNKSQFFITYRSCRHLDSKHTVFGNVVGGMDTLGQIEQIEVDNEDRPIEDIIILKTQIFVDPFEEADEKLKADRALELEKSGKAIEVKEEEVKKSSAIAPGIKVAIFKSGIGKYINPEIVKKKRYEKSDSVTPLKKKSKIVENFGNFDSW